MLAYHNYTKAVSMLQIIVENHDITDPKMVKASAPRRDNRWIGNHRGPFAEIC